MRSCRSEAVRRSLLALRLMTDESTGGIVAAPTTSLPEDFGGERNWDYRYCWLRDAALTLGSLIRAGYTEEAHLWRDWLLRTIAGDPSEMQVLYAVDGGRRVPEVTLDHLPGYRFGCATSPTTPAAGPSFAVVGWVTAPVDDDARRLKEGAMGGACHGATDEHPCLREGDDVADVWGRVSGATGWVVLVAGTAEYARSG